MNRTEPSGLAVAPRGRRSRAIPHLLVALGFLHALATTAGANCFSRTIALPTCDVPTNPWNGDGTAEPWADPGQWEHAQADFEFSPYLTLQDDTHVVVSWRTKGPATGVLMYSTSPDWSTSTSLPACDDKQSGGERMELGHQQTVALGTTSLPDFVGTPPPALSPDTRYYYRAVICDPTNPQTNPGKYMDGTFLTPGENTTSFRLAGFGEFHASGNSASVLKFAHEVATFKPHAIIESGDMLDGVANFSDLYSYMQTSATWLPNTFLLPMYSNHVLWAYSGDTVRVPNFFSLPDGRTLGDCYPKNGKGPRGSNGHRPWYATRYGSVQVLTLADAATKVNSCDIPEQEAWLKQQVLDAHDGVDDPLFLFAAFHEPIGDITATNHASGDFFFQTIANNGGGDLLLVGHDNRSEMTLHVPKSGPNSMYQIQTNLKVVSGRPTSNPCRAANRRFLAMTVDGATNTLSAKFVNESNQAACCMSIQKMGGATVTTPPGPC